MSRSKKEVGNRGSLRGDLVIPRNPHRNWISFNLKLKLSDFALIVWGKKKKETQYKLVSPLFSIFSYLWIHYQVSNMIKYDPIRCKKIISFDLFLFVHSKSSFRYNWARCLQDIKSCPTIQYAITPPMLQIKDHWDKDNINL